MNIIRSYIELGIIDEDDRRVSKAISCLMRDLAVQKSSNKEE